MSDCNWNMSLPWNMGNNKDENLDPRLREDYASLSGAWGTVPDRIPTPGHLENDLGRQAGPILNYSLPDERHPTAMPQSVFFNLDSSPTGAGMGFPNNTSEHLPTRTYHKGYPTTPRNPYNHMLPTPSASSNSEPRPRALDFCVDAIIMEQDNPATLHGSYPSPTASRSGRWSPHNPSMPATPDNHRLGNAVSAMNIDLSSLAAAEHAVDIPSWAQSNRNVTNQFRSPPLPPRDPSTACSCPHCGKPFGKKCDLAHHRRIHEGRRHPCHRCGWAFHFPKDLRRHVKSHSPSVRHLLCNVSGCKYHRIGFLRRDHWQRHMRTKHPGGLFAEPEARREGDAGVEVGRS